MLNQFIKSHPKVDTNRIYVVGFSVGGDGVWNMILKNPKLFAAAMPIAVMPTSILVIMMLGLP